MKLIASTTSPFARKVRIVLAEKNLAAEFVVDIPWNADTQVPLHNPLGKVPVLLCDDGEALYDSRVIVDYLEALKPWPLLIPAEVSERIAVKKWEALADGVSDAAAAIFIERKRPESQQSPDWISRQQQKIRLGLAAMEQGLRGDYCRGGAFTLADIAVGACLGYLDFRFAELAWQKSCPALAALQARLEARASFQGSRPAV